MAAGVCVVSALPWRQQSLNHSMGNWAVCYHAVHVLETHDKPVQFVTILLNSQRIQEGQEQKQFELLS